MRRSAAASLYFLALAVACGTGCESRAPTEVQPPSFQPAPLSASSPSAYVPWAYAAPGKDKMHLSVTVLQSTTNQQDPCYIRVVPNVTYTSTALVITLQRLRPPPASITCVDVLVISPPLEIALGRPYSGEPVIDGATGTPGEFIKAHGR